jgi:hypothetical protein
VSRFVSGDTGNAFKQRSKGRGAEAGRRSQNRETLRLGPLWLHFKLAKWDFACAFSLKRVET